MEVYFPVLVQAQGFVDHACCGGSTPWFPQNLGWPLFLGCGFMSSRLNMAAKCLLSSVSQVARWKKGEALIGKDSGTQPVMLSLTSC